MSRNKKLATFSCMDNQLTSLKLPNSKTLKYVYCEINKIRGEAMDELIASLPKYSSSEGYGKLYIYNNSDDKYPEGNQLTPDQEQAALAKGWRSWEYDNSQHNYYTSDGYVMLDEINFPDPLFLDYLNENFYNDDFGPRLHDGQTWCDTRDMVSKAIRAKRAGMRVMLHDPENKQLMEQQQEDRTTRRSLCHIRVE